MLKKMLVTFVGAVVGGMLIMAAMHLVEIEPSQAAMLKNLPKIPLRGDVSITQLRVRKEAEFRDDVWLYASDGTAWKITANTNQLEVRCDGVLTSSLGTDGTWTDEVP